jgi:hypothetical protein
MAGLINKDVNKSAPPVEDEPGEGAEHEMQEGPAEEQVEDQAEGETESGEESTGKLTPQSVREKLELPPELKEAYERVVLAGMKVMFDPQTHEMALKAIQGEGPVEQRLAQGIAGLMGTLIDQSNQTMPPQVVIPAGIELLVAAGDYLRESGADPITDEQIGEAMAQFVQIVLEQAGADPTELQAMLQGGMGEGAAPAGEMPAEQAPAPKGLVNRGEEA